MKALQFDGITRELGDHATRRGFFRLLGGAAALSAGLVLTTQDDSLAKNRGKQHGQHHGKQQGSGRASVAAQRRGGGGGGAGASKKITICFKEQTRKIKKSKLGNFPGATRGACVAKPQVVCTSWVLSGGPDPNTSIAVDDDLQVMVNGVVLQPTDNNKQASQLAPLRFTANPGDSLGIVATDANPAARSLSPLWLHCATTPAQKRQLFAGNFDGAAPGRTAGTFESRVFTI
jgi:hypothetical protein